MTGGKQFVILKLAFFGLILSGAIFSDALGFTRRY